MARRVAEARRIAGRGLHVRDHEHDLGRWRHAVGQCTDTASRRDARHVRAVPFRIAQRRRDLRTADEGVDFACQVQGAVVLREARRVDRFRRRARVVALVPHRQDARPALLVAKRLVQHVDAVVDDADQRTVALFGNRRAMDLGSAHEGHRRIQLRLAPVPARLDRHAGVPFQHLELFQRHLAGGDVVELRIEGKPWRRLPVGVPQPQQHGERVRSAAAWRPRPRPGQFAGDARLPLDFQPHVHRAAPGQPRDHRDVARQRVVAQARKQPLDRHVDYWLRARHLPSRSP